MTYRVSYLHMRGYRVARAFDTREAAQEFIDVNAMVCPLPGVRLEEPEPAAAAAEPAPCACYSCDGECAGTNEPDSCGRLEDVAGQPVCATCRKVADVFAEPESRRAGIKVTSDGHQVTVKADTFDRPRWMVFDPAMARVLGMKLLELSWECELGEASTGVAELLAELRAAIDGAK